MSSTAFSRTTDIKVYTATGDTTWNKPVGAKFIKVVLIGGGGGGGAGRKVFWVRPAPGAPEEPEVGGMKSFYPRL